MPYRLNCQNGSLCEKSPNTEFFLVCIFPFSLQKKLHIWTPFTQWWFFFARTPSKTFFAQWPRTGIKLFHVGDPYQIESSLSICSSNQLDWFLFDRELRHERVEHGSTFTNKYCKTRVREHTLLRKWFFKAWNVQKQTIIDFGIQKTLFTKENGKILVSS